MKLGISLFIIIGLATCNSLKLEKNPVFKIIGGTYNNWVGGQPGISGIRMVIEYESAKKIDFKGIYFSNKYTKAELKQEKNKMYVVAHFDT